MLRGALGSVLRATHCVADCQSAKSCFRRGDCQYARIFEPRPAVPSVSGLADWPRPFVFRAAHLDGRIVAPKSRFHVDVNVFDASAKVALMQAFQQIAAEGIGSRRSRLVFQGAEERGVQIDLSRERNHAGRLLVKFLTPTELKGGTVPSFGLLAARIRDRVSTLLQLYGNVSPMALDYRLFGERAQLVELVRCDLQPVKVVRHSSRTGQSHSLGGFIGEAEYAGDCGEFIPYLEAATYTGVGRQTVWGKGQIAIESRR